MNGNTSHTLVDDLDLSGVKTGTDMETEPVCGARNGHSAMNGAANAIECREDRVGRCSDLPASEVPDLRTRLPIVAVQHAPPSPIASSLLRHVESTMSVKRTVGRMRFSSG